MSKELRVRTNKHLTILTNDPSLTAWGYAVIRNDVIIDCGCIKTAPEHKKTRIRKSDDTVRRISEINKVLLEKIGTYNVDFLLSEAPHGSQNASAAAMVGMVAGMIQTMSDVLKIPVEWYSEMDSKKFVLGKKSATKTEMINAIKSLYKVPWKRTKYIDEAIADAIAVYHTACGLSPTLKLLK